MNVTDRIGWLAASPDLELRAITLELGLPLGATAGGSARLVLHDARVFGQSWEALVLGNAAGVGSAAAAAVSAVLPEARVLVSAGVQRITADLQAPHRSRCRT